MLMELQMVCDKMSEEKEHSYNNDKLTKDGKPPK